MTQKLPPQTADPDSRNNQVTLKKHFSGNWPAKGDYLKIHVHFQGRVKEKHYSRSENEKKS